MKKGFHGWLIAATLLPAAVSAESLSYNFVEGGLALYPSFESQTFIGLDTRGSIAINENVFAFGGLKYLTDDVDLTALHIGGGFRHGIDARTDLWGGVTMEYQDADYSGVCNGCGSVDDTALGLRGGLRHQVDEKLEVGGSARIITGDLDYVGLTGTGRYAVDRNLKLFGEVDLYDGELGLIGGVTLDF
ncbi:hypothetical protein [Marinobacter confluentis]|uniref:Outer membrane protein beta-barrel domain-containing protein n=1 Tax=Marinobacter confluentis TaxID=1697557 RepID=A0A4Z1BT67_9GAMM|nr:hypothetical protein [Marinobacter confluentis]TGN40389.1 hypothetical protein E5Q11_08975 [Marinobacter confluentis]